MIFNKKLVPLKAHYFLFFAGISPVLPFLPVYARQQGMSTTGIGIIYTVIPFIGLIAKTTSGALSDWLQIHRGMFLSAIILCALGIFSIQFNPAVPQKPSHALAHVELECSASSTSFKYCIPKARCGPNNFLSISGDYTTDCEVMCDIQEKDTMKICDDWNVSSSCRAGELNFTASTILLDYNKRHLCTSFFISNIMVAGEELADITCPTQITINCTMVCDDGRFMNYLHAPLTIPPTTYDELLSHYQFWLYLCAIAIAWCGQAVTIVMTDTISYQLLGWGTLAVISGALIDFFSKGLPEKNYTPAFFLSFVILFFDLLTASRLKVGSNERKKISVGSVIRLICEPRIVLFVFCCIVVGMSTGILLSFQLMFVEDVAFQWDCQFESLKLLQGLILGVQCFLGELPFFFLSGWLIKKLKHASAISLTITVLGFRFIIYYFITNPWFFLPMEVLNGITFGLFYATMTSYASLVAPPGTEATMQGIFGAAFEGIGFSIGGFAGGFLFLELGGAEMFLCIGVFNLIFTSIHIFLVSRFRSEYIITDYSSFSDGYNDSMRPDVACDADSEDF
ncbi:major facilitator superfamily domain-containing protein 6-like isoform X2 [Panulirus ornatus]|uniref:major facilitator superfamily domain-containing protein 6-like isoform X2 n=1 Tax=Panulirus ornatus TaxID=150431 RepID=UPI003A89EB7A